MPSIQNKYKIELAPLAKADIEDIIQYTQETYGSAKRKSYSADIRKALRNIKENPHLGHAREDIDTNHKAWTINSHVIVYAVTDSRISIFRVLHSHRDFRVQFYQ